jgi:colanic acid biosynthesis glycosyl transferase WcaI
VRIVIVNQFFWPDVAPTGVLLCDLARHLNKEGHDVTVICSGGAYTQVACDGRDRPPVKIIRIPGIPYRRGALGRLFSYATFFAGALWYELRVYRPDVVVSMTTPPLLAVAGAIVKSLRGARHFIWEMDLFPDAFVALGALAQNGLATRFLGRIEDYIRRHSDGIIVLGPCMRTRLLERGTPAHLIHVAENWADGSTISPRPNRHSGPLNIFYSGNLGMAHDIDTIADAMRNFRNDPRFLFTFAGGGVGRTRMQQMCAAERIENVRFLPYVISDDMEDHLAQADIGLVTERSSCIGTVVPSKTYSLMAAGRPILFIGPREATPSLLIDRFQCGWQIDPGDSRMLFTLLEWLSISHEAVRTSGQRARTAFDNHYDMRHGVARVAAALGIGEVSSAPVWEFVAPGSGPDLPVADSELA